MPLGSLRLPKAEWVQTGFDRLVKAGEAEWLNRASGKLNARFTKHDDVLAHFVEICAKDQEATGQLPLFKDTR